MPTFYYITSNIKCKLAQLEDRLSDQIKKVNFMQYTRNNLNLML